MKNPLFTSEIDEIIVKLLGDALYKTTDLLEVVQKPYPVSKQGFYDALRRLKKAQIILINKKIVSLNRLWIESLVNFTRGVAQTYEETYQLESKYLNLQPSERVSYSFKSIEEADIFWNHAILLLIKNLDKQIPVTIYNPHQWFIIARYEAESLVWRTLAQEGALVLFLIGGETELDKKTVTTINKLHSHAIASLGEKELLKKTCYINIFGNIIVEMKIPLEIADKIEAWFQTGRDDRLRIQELQKIIQSTARIKFIFSNNPKRAQKLRRQIEKHFHIPKGYKR